MKKTLSILLSAFLFFQSFSPILAVDQWRQFRHDWYRTAATSYELTNNGDNNNNAFSILWKKEFAEWPHENAGPIIADNTLYYSLMDGTIRAIDAQTNSYTEKWVVDTGASLNNSPAVYDNRVYLVNIRGRVMALDPQTGQTIWEFQLPTDVYSSPVYANGRIFIGGIDGKVYAFDAEDGNLGPIWTFTTPYGMIDSALVFYNNKIYFQSENMHAYALNWQDGSVVWDVAIPGDKTWNGSPVVVKDANRVVFQTLSVYEPDYNSGSTYRDVCDGCPGHYDVGFDSTPDLTALQAFDNFISSNRPWVNTNVVLDANTGGEIRNFMYNNNPISVIPFTSMYWNSIRWSVYKNKFLYAEGNRRSWKIDLSNGNIESLPFDNSGNFSYFVRGDENVLTIISGNRIIGGIRKNLAALDINTKTRYQLQGDYANESSDATHMFNRTFNTPHYQTHPGDGYTGSNSELLPYKDRVFYVDNGWLIAMKPSFGSVTDINTDTTPPSVPTNLQTSTTDNQVDLSWDISTDNTKTTTYQVFRDGQQISTTMTNTYIDLAVANGQHNYQVQALDWVENTSPLSIMVQADVSGGLVETACQKADITQDNLVDLSDYSLIALNFFSTSPSNPRADINGDGLVDLTDYSLLAIQFLQTCQ